MPWPPPTTPAAWPPTRRRPLACGPGSAPTSGDAPEPGQARQLFEPALAILEARLGPDHPETASNLDNLANVLRDLGDLPAARGALERAQVVFEDRLGLDHPDLAQTRKNLQIVLDELRKAPDNRMPTGGTPPLFEARVGAGNPLATLIP